MTIYPFAIYVKGKEKVKEESFVVISENTKHDVNAVILFRNKLKEYIKNKFENRIKKSFMFLMELEVSIKINRTF